MKRGKNRTLWAASLMVLGIADLAQFGLRMAGIQLPDAAVRLLGALYLIALPVLGFTTARGLMTGDTGHKERSNGNGDK